jgi:RHS repeat-associated protein
VISSSGTLAGPFGFVGGQGYQQDSDSGLMLLGARYYDPSVGRFVSRDPIGHEGGLNLYGYCEDDPVNSLDSDGCSRTWPVGPYGIPDDPTDPTRRKPTPKDIPVDWGVKPPPPGTGVVL